MTGSTARAGADRRTRAERQSVREDPRDVYRFLDHTAELELQVSAPTKEGVLAEAAAAMHDLLGVDDDGPSTVRRIVEVAAADDAALLAAWLDELVFLSETEGFVPEHTEDVRVEGCSAAGVVVGRSGAPRHLVKGATYNDLELRFDGALWHGRVVLDV